MSIWLNQLLPSWHSNIFSKSVVTQTAKQKTCALGNSVRLYAPNSSHLPPGKGEMFLEQCQQTNLQIGKVNVCSSGLFSMCRLKVTLFYFFIKIGSVNQWNRLTRRDCKGVCILWSVFLFWLKFNFSLHRSLYNSIETWCFYSFGMSCKGAGLSFDKRSMMSLNINNVLISR